ncbi:hypothetical protein JSE7799_02075 [Jannaschia seosinensis]|uniref:Uncharacterized protein n=1 Tax=Jannaschia seosinensis TaxID=313367 RepID=A0A0M7BAE5_9RHOB|nr:hypothetical protein JSE7799_02075 [Jannaschia seosinensis]
MAEPVRVQIGLDEAGQLCVGHGAGEPAIGTAIGGAASAGRLPLVLGIEFAHHPLRHRLQLADAGPTLVGLVFGPQGIMRHNEPVTGEGGFCDALVEGEVLEGLDQVDIATGRHCQDELQRALRPFSDRGQFGDVVEAEQAAVGHQHHPLDREAREHLLQHPLQGLRLGDVAGVDRMQERQSFCGLDHAEDELPGDAAAFLVHAEGAQIVGNLPLAVNAHSGQVVEHDRKVSIDQGAELAAQRGLDGIKVVHQGVHGAQELLVCRGLRHPGHRDRLQPPQASQLRLRRAKPVEHHRPDQRLGIEAAPG